MTTVPHTYEVEREQERMEGCGWLCYEPRGGTAEYEDRHHAGWCGVAIWATEISRSIWHEKKGGRKEAVDGWTGRTVEARPEDLGWDEEGETEEWKPSIRVVAGSQDGRILWRGNAQSSQ